MQKIFAVLVAFCLLFVTVAPLADASSRVRRTLRNTQTTPYSSYYQAPVYQTPYYPQPAQVYPTSAGSTYYYSSNYVAGYTYYSTPTPGYYYYSNIPTQTVTSTATQQGQYYFSPNYIAGYTYYSSPTAGYYYYYNTTIANQGNYYQAPQNNSNMICTVVNNIYQCTQNSYGPVSSTYPGCSSADIIIGGQIWASCNALDRNAGSTAKSGWFFAGDVQSTFTSYNGSNTTLEWMGKQTQTSAWTTGPCAPGYRLPNRGEWEVLQSYARANSSTIANLISLQSN